MAMKETYSIAKAFYDNNEGEYHGSRMCCLQGQHCQSNNTTCVRRLYLVSTDSLWLLNIFAWKHEYNTDCWFCCTVSLRTHAAPWFLGLQYPSSLLTNTGFVYCHDIVRYQLTDLIWLSYIVLIWPNLGKVNTTSLAFWVYFSEIPGSYGVRAMHLFLEYVSPKYERSATRSLLE